MELRVGGEVQAVGYEQVREWAVNCADEIKSELKVRESLRLAYRKAAEVVALKNHPKQVDE
jgi:hypothetical protein